MKELFETNFMASIVMIDIASQSVLEFRIFSALILIETPSAT